MERWKAVPGYEGRYEVSDFGRVRSLPNSRRKDTRILKHGVCRKSGYHNVNLSKDGKAKTVRVHLLVLEAFEGPRPGGSYEVHGCHGDGDPSNNRLSNLRWDTVIANHADKSHHGTAGKGERNSQAKITLSQARSIKEQLRNKKRGDVAKVARTMGISYAIVMKIANGSRWAHA